MTKRSSVMQDVQNCLRIGIFRKLGAIKITHYFKIMIDPCWH